MIVLFVSRFRTLSTAEKFGILGGAMTLRIL